MKKLLLLVAIIAISSCDKLDDCLMQSGEMSSRQVEIEGFDKILVNRGISLVVSEGDGFQVNIVTGENLMESIEAKVENATLILTDRAECNWRRSYGVTTVFVTAPNIRQIQSLTEQKISSGNQLHFPHLHLIALGNGTSDFHLDVDNQEVFIESNTVSGFYLSGRTSSLVAAFYEGNGPLHAKSLDADAVYVFHRGSNHMFVKAVQEITGDIYSTGNVYCSGQPATVDVRRHYTGRLMFTD